VAQQQIQGTTGSLGAGGALAVYNVPGSAIVTPYSASATFDGTGAGGAFLPCLTFKTQTGAVIARCPAPEVASGDVAEVSWFPHVASAAAAPSSSSEIIFAQIVMDGIISLPHASTVIFDMDPTTLYTNSPSVFTTYGWVHRGHTYHRIGALVDGHYLAKGQLVIGGTESATDGYVNGLYVQNPGYAAGYGDAGVFEDFPVATAQGQRTFYVEGLCTVNGGSTDPYILQVQNTSSTDFTMYFGMMVWQLDTNNTYLD